jgi:DNA-binding CsgD family transcriptional regulator
MIKPHGKAQLVLLFCIISQICFTQEVSRYVKYIQQASDNLNVTTNEPQAFLDSIPRPLEDYIDGHLDEYYIAQGHIYDITDNDVQSIHSFNKALTYALKENDYFHAGDACIQLYRVLYSTSKDNDLAVSYLNKAKVYFEKCDNVFGLYEIELIDAYMKYMNNKNLESINVLLPNLDKYKDVLLEDAYIYMDATAQLALNYMAIDSITKAKHYYHKFKTSINSPSAPKINYNSFNACINVELAWWYFKNKQLDSCKFHAAKARQQLDYLDRTYVISYYDLCVDVNNSIRNFDTAQIYLDSLRSYENELLSNQLIATNEISNFARISEEALEAERTKRKQNVLFVCILAFVLVLLSCYYYFIYKKQKRKLHKVSSEIDTLSYVKSNNEQLAVKVHGLEKYLKTLKNEVKEIAVTKCLEHQKVKIKELYKSLHINSSTILDKSDSHLDLVNDLNIDFFKKINELYPQLNKSEVIICYYVLIGFSNKEISVFLNTSIRSVESKRYRISKKIDFDKKKMTLVEHLHHTFKDTLNSEISL